MFDRSINRVILLGNIGNDPETRTVGNDTTLTTFSLATKESWKPQNGDRQEKTQWHQVVAWRGLGDLAAKYLSKGQAVLVEGKIEYDQYEKDGEKRYATKIVASHIQMAGKSDRAAVENGAAEQEAPETTADVPF